MEQYLRISITWGNCRISKRSFGEDSMMMIYQNPEALNKTNDPLQWIFASKPHWTKGYTLKLQGSRHHQDKWGVGKVGKMKEQKGFFVLFCCLFAYLFWFDCLIFFWWEGCAGIRWSYNWTGRWAELGCMMRNSQGFNKEIMLNLKKISYWRNPINVSNVIKKTLHVTIILKVMKEFIMESNPM